jgi:hypothetical protein
MFSPFFMMPIILLSIETFGPAKILLCELLAAQAALVAQKAAHLDAKSPSSCQTLILTFLVIKSFI